MLPTDDSLGFIYVMKWVPLSPAPSLACEVHFHLLIETQHSQEFRAPSTHPFSTLEFRPPSTHPFSTLPTF